MLILITTCYYCTSGIVFFMITKVLHVFAEPWKIQKQSLALTFCPRLSPMHLQIKNKRCVYSVYIHHSYRAG